MRRRRPSRAILVVLAVGAAALIAIGVWAATGVSAPAGSDKQAGLDQVEVFTFVESGIVYVDPETSEIVWQNEQRDRKIIGEEPWRNPEPTDPGVGPVPPWGENRDIVGNPDHNVVSWVESEKGGRGDIVVVEAQTGDVLARAAVEGEPDASVVISSVDDEAVYYAVVDRNWPFPDVPGDTLQVWRWASGEEPEASPRDDVYFNDVSAGVLAFYGEEGVIFETADRRSLSVAPYPVTGRTDFGGALSPDGRFWYGAETSQVVETASGEVIDLSTGKERAYGWTSADELVLTVCEPGTGSCQTHTCVVGGGAAAVVCAPGLRWAEAAESSPTGVCLPYGLACGSRLPVF